MKETQKARVTELPALTSFNQLVCWEGATRVYMGYNQGLGSYFEEKERFGKSLF